jgi:type I restriction enzyme S subunit
LNQDLKAVKPLENIRSAYLALALKAFERDILHTCTKTGTTVQSLELPVFLRFQIPVAPLPEQRRIVAEMEKQFTRLEAGVAALRRVQANLKRFRAAVLKAACEGRLVPTEADLVGRVPPRGGAVGRLPSTGVRAKGNAASGDAAYKGTRERAPPM